MLNYILYRIGEFISLYLPLKLVYALAGLISYLQYLLSKKDRTSVSNNLRAIFPDMEDTLIKKYTKGVFINFGIYLANFFKFKKIDLAYIRENVIIKGLDNVDRALSAGKGLILFSAHIGNWELGGITLGLMGYPMNAVTLTHKHKKVNIFFTRQRQSKNLKVIPLGNAVRSCLEAFSRNEIVCIMGDRDFTQGGIIVDLFGKPTMIPKGPAIFHLRNQTPLVAAFTVRQENGKFCLFFNPQIQFAPSGNYENDIRSLTGIYLKQIEDCIRAYPGQWSMFRRFWL